MMSGWRHPLALSVILASALSIRASVLLKTAGLIPHAEGRWVVVFRNETSAEARADHLERHRAIADRDPVSKIHSTFNINGFEGYAARFSDDHLEVARAEDDMLEYMEVDGVVRLAAPIHSDNVDASPANASTNNKNFKSADGCSVQSNAIWGLTRVAQREKNLNSKYYYSGTGSGVDAYVLDTGVYIEHNDFEGRATWGASFVGESTDNNGHGTHCAGTIAGATYGVAKGATIISVQVLTGTGSGTMSGVISGLEWVCQRHQKKGDGRKCVVNLSLSGGAYSAMDTAANYLASCGCAVVAAAGNDGANACASSPARASDVITVGATNNKDQRPYFSNYGSCVNVFAPGVYIKSTWIGNANALNSISGTSMAAPHVAGVAALMMASGKSSSSSIQSDIMSGATSGAISNLDDNSPNLLLYTGEGCI